MFLLGLLTGIVLASVVIWLWLMYETNVGLRRPRLFDPRREVAGLERQTIHQMLAAEMALRRQGGSRDVVEGTASEIVPRP
jgi:hypothetical protein